MSDVSATTERFTLATPANMRAFEERNDGRRAIAMSVVDSSERYSATFDDYFWMSPDQPMVDSYGERMILVVEQPATYRDALTGENV
jgi:uncharacterized protein with von Willebrand factor type A (vWA) domain